MDFSIIFPKELLLMICELLPPADVLRLGQVNRKLRVISEEEYLWEHLLQRDFKLEPDQIWDHWTARNLYMKVLYPHRWLFGWWKLHVIHYGGLIRVRYANSEIVAEEALPPYDFCSIDIEELRRRNLIEMFADVDEILPEKRHVLRYRRLFSMRPTPFKDLRVLCHQSLDGYAKGLYHSPCKDSLSNTEHTCTGECNQKHKFLRKTENGFEFVCDTAVTNHNSLYAFDTWFLREHGFMDRGNNLQSIMISLLDHHYEIRLAQYKAIADTSNKMRFSRFDTISQLSTAMIPNCIIQPGIFVGTYSAHGWEFIDVQYDGSDANNRILRGTKITGDPNIPAGQVSFEIQIDKPIQLQQDTLTDRDALVEAVSDYEQDAGRPNENDREFVRSRHDFILPDGFIERITFIPNHCMGYYLARGQIAGHNFHQPTFISLLFVQFSNDVFGLLWLDLGAFAMLYRIKSFD